jgi:hypothetical protein
LATDAFGCSGSQVYHLTVECAAISLAPADPLPGGTVGTVYTQTITAGGSAYDYTYAQTSGTLPSGLTLSVAGVLSGTPTAAGAYSFDVTATDTKGCTGVKTYHLTMTCPVITLLPASLPFGLTNISYSVSNNTIAASGGAAPYTYSVSSGVLPAGLTMSTGGVISGTPTVPGTSTFTVAAMDVNSCVGTKQYAILVAEGPLIKNLQLIAGDAQLLFTSISNAYYDVQSTTDLVSGSWTTIASNLVGTSGVMTNIDSGAATVPRRFYRVRLHF